MVVKKQTSAFLQHNLLLSPTKPADECYKDGEIWGKKESYDPLLKVKGSLSRNRLKMIVEAARLRRVLVEQSFLNSFAAATELHLVENTADVLHGGSTAHVQSPEPEHFVLGVSQAPVLQLNPLQVAVAQPQAPHKLLPPRRRHVIHHRVQNSRGCGHRGKP